MKCYQLRPLLFFIICFSHRRFPFRTDTSPIYELTYIYVSIIGYIVVLAYGCVDGIFITLCVYIGAQFMIIQQNLLDLNNSDVLRKTFSDATKYNKHECDKMLLQLSRLIQRHVDTIHLNNDVSELFEIIVLLQFLTAAVSIGLAACLLTMSTAVMDAFLYSSHVFVFLTQLYIYCYAGSFVMNSVRILSCTKKIHTVVLLCLPKLNYKYTKMPIL